ncbi:MAG: MoaD/ThiS family protein [Deltaproteobacteria bacterium]|nr:MoaD/ThiS family protein [Deltaproteobacteria bacterium]
MKITIKLFAMLKESLGEEVELEVPDPVTVGRMLELFCSEHPRFAPALPSLKVAVDHVYAMNDEEIRAGQEVAIIPPVSGGR